MLLVFTLSLQTATLVVACLVVHGSALLPDNEPDDNVLHIGGIFPIAGEGGWQGGQVP